MKPIDLTESNYNPDDIEKKREFGINDFDRPDAPMDKKDFLKQFPKNIVKDGKLIPIREELEKKFKET